MSKENISGISKYALVCETGIKKWENPTIKQIIF